MAKSWSFFFVLAGCIASLAVGCKKGLPTGPDGEGMIEVSGVITMGGVGQANVAVYLSWDESHMKTTGPDGKFSFEDLKTGRYLITPSKQGTAFSPSNYEVGSSTRTDLNFTASAVSYGAEVNQIAANFTAADQHGDPVNLYDYHGKVVLLDFSADWCMPCREKAEHAEEFYQKYKDKGFIYILIIIEGSPFSWAQTYGLTFPVLDDNPHAIYNILRKSSIPLPHVLDRNLTIRYKTEGWNQAEVEDWLKKYL